VSRQPQPCPPALRPPAPVPTREMATVTGQGAQRAQHTNTPLQTNASTSVVTWRIRAAQSADPHEPSPAPPPPTYTGATQVSASGVLSSAGGAGRGAGAARPQGSDAAAAGVPGGPHRRCTRAVVAGRLAASARRQGSHRAARGGQLEPGAAVSPLTPCVTSHAVPRPAVHVVCIFGARRRCGSLRRAGWLQAALPTATAMMPLRQER
jgi:hypothetical protein